MKTNQFLESQALTYATGTIPVEYINYDLWAEMRAHDKELADEILEPTFTFMRAQTDKSRIGINKLGHYLEYREKDVGKAYVDPSLYQKTPH